MGIKVTFATSVYAQRRMAKTTGATHMPGYDDGFKLNIDDANKYMVEIRSQGSKALKDIIANASEQGRPVTCLVYTLLLPWASEVAREHHIPCALLWIQPATVMGIYYYYFNGYGDEVIASSKDNDPTWEIQFPGIPLTLSKRDLPSFLIPAASNTYSFVLTSFKEQLDALDAETKPKVLVNTFDALESGALRAIDHKYELIGVGPLIPSDPFVPSDPPDKSFEGDLFQKSDDIIKWLNSKPDSSVVYVSFGSLLNLQKAQMEEIPRGLLDSGKPFLWVIRKRTNKEEDDNGHDQKLICLEEIEKIGKIVGWCSQLEVLTHRAVGCFMTHCRWNSTLESISCSVLVVAFPHWKDQGTNTKLIEDVWGTGARVRINEDGMVERGEIRRCVEEVMGGGEKSQEVRENAVKWKGLAREAIGENGSSYKNLKAFLEEIGA
ncbi:crocetin glucosyltransferase chloroplastic [Phtheirospermum japonicum]|uniref:anthocyanidin 3-O-glucoside 5-O-glucosyltransferase n=1 Tax=Phtheirospermum japonicum TaxID=374723 RepID=A0A830DFL8_9LAMI|nr:crocetin glucosyltransferase chloroplastic [Phtheirospermum japonicum]